jgi:hypothetical protein
MSIVKVLFGNGMLLFLSLFSMVLIVYLIFVDINFSNAVSEQNEIYNKLEEMRESPEDINEITTFGFLCLRLDSERGYELIYSYRRHGFNTFEPVWCNKYPVKRDNLGNYIVNGSIQDMEKIKIDYLNKFRQDRQNDMKNRSGTGIPVVDLGGISTKLGSRNK